MALDSPAPLGLLYARTAVVPARRKSRSNSAGWNRAQLAPSTGIIAAPSLRRRVSRKKEGDLLARFGSHCTELLPKEYEWVDILGEGEYGIAIRACRRSSNSASKFAGKAVGESNKHWPECVVIKLQEIDNLPHFRYEVRMHKKFHDVGLAPRLHDSSHWHRDKDNKLIGGIVMDQVTGTLDRMLRIRQDNATLEQILRWIVDKIEVMCKHRLTHGDMHWENMAYILDDPLGDVPAIRPALIDFGFASDHDCNPALELIQTLRTIHPDYAPKIDSKNERYLSKRLVAIYQGTYNPRVSLQNEEMIEKEFDRLRAEQNDVIATHAATAAAEADDDVA